MGFIITGVIAIVIAYLVYYDAQKREVNALAWFVGSLIIWFLPGLIYLAVRKKYPVKEVAINKTLPGFRTKTSWKMILSGFLYAAYLFVIIMVGIGTAKAGNTSAGTAAKVSAAPAAQQTATPQAPPAPANAATTAQPQPTQTPAALSLDDLAKKAVHDAIPQSTIMKNGDAYLGSSTVDNVFIIETEAEDNLTHNMIKEGILIDTSKIIKELFQDQRINDVRLVWYFPHTDAYGNETNEVAEKIEFTRDTVSKINWANFLFDNIPQIADGFEVNPNFDQ